MSEKNILLLKTQLYQQSSNVDLLDFLQGVDVSSAICVNPLKMKIADWDQVLQKILDHDQCLTL